MGFWKKEEENEDWFEGTDYVAEEEKQESSFEDNIISFLGAGIGSFLFLGLILLLDNGTLLEYLNIDIEYSHFPYLYILISVLIVLFELCLYKLFGLSELLSQVRNTFFFGLIFLQIMGCWVYGLFFNDHAPYSHKMKLKPLYTVETIVTHKEQYHESRVNYDNIYFNVNGKSEKYDVAESAYPYYELGDSIMVVFGEGAWGKILPLDIALIDGRSRKEVLRGMDLEEKDGQLAWIVDTDTADDNGRADGVAGQTESTKTAAANEEESENSNIKKQPEKQEPDIEIFGEYIKKRVPELGKSHEGWTEASFTIDKDGNVSNVKVTGYSKVSKAVRKALTDMGKWVGDHKEGQKEKVKISLAYRLGKPFYMISERIVSSDDGTKLKIQDEFDLSGDFGFVRWSVHEETKM